MKAIMPFRIGDYKTVKIDEVWAGHPVRFCVVPDIEGYIIGYFNKERQMCVAKYNPADAKIEKAVLPEELGWDSHNRISIGCDSDGYIHVSGNMHKHPLKYFRSVAPGMMAFQRIDRMTGMDEESCTYPMFFRDGHGGLFFQYRNGKSGKGNNFINQYQLRTQKWERISDGPLFDGEEKANAYPTEFVLGDDGYFHLAWVWRAAPACETNHTLCYAKTKDFTNWFDARGIPLAVPFRASGGDVIDDVPVCGGILNGSIKIGFDQSGEVVVSYHKFDSNGKTQIFNACFRDGSWRIFQTSQWDYRWFFEGGGTIALEIVVFPVKSENGALTQEFNHKKYGEGIWTLNGEDFSVLSTEALSKDVQEIKKCTRENFIAQFANDVGSPSFLRWESLPANRDKEREVGEGEESSDLVLYLRK